MMEKIQLSKRLTKVAEYVREDEPILDVGSDHAYLPIYLIQQELVPSAIAGEVVAGPFQKAVEQVERHGLTSKISPRLGDGLDVLTDDDKLGTIFICGMGGSLIANILKEGMAHNKLPEEVRLVLQPNNGEKILRELLQAKQYHIIHESIIEENDKIYEIIVAEYAKTAISYNEFELTFGPLLLNEKSHVFKIKWQSELKKYKSIKKQLRQSKNKHKMIEIEAMIQKIKQVIR